MIHQLDSHPILYVRSSAVYWSIRSAYCRIKTSQFPPFIIYTIPRSRPQFTIPPSLRFHLQLWNSHPARRHLTPALTIYANCPRNTDPGRHPAIFANSARKDQHSHERPSEGQTGVLHFTGDLITRQCHSSSDLFLHQQLCILAENRTHNDLIIRSNAQKLVLTGKTETIIKL